VEHEIPMFGPLLDQIAGLDGALVTADVLHAQREHAIYLHNAAISVRLHRQG